MLRVSLRLHRSCSHEARSLRDSIPRDEVMTSKWNRSTSFVLLYFICAIFFLLESLWMLHLHLRSIHHSSFALPYSYFHVNVPYLFIWGRLSGCNLGASRCCSDVMSTSLAQTDTWHTYMYLVKYTLYMIVLQNSAVYILCFTIIWDRSCNNGPRIRFTAILNIGWSCPTIYIVTSTDYR